MLMRKDKYIALAFLTGFIYRILISLQGIDHSDVGFSNTFFQSIFSHPEAMTFSFNYYLTGLFGGIWELLFGHAGLLGFRLFEAFTLTASIFLVYKTFERQLSSTPVAITAILVSFLFPSVIITFHYDTLSFFFIALALWCYSKAVRQQNSAWMWLAGMALGICFFVRIVNGVLLLTAFIPILFGILNHKVKAACRQSALILAGMASGCMLVVAIMAAIGHLSYFIAGLNDAFGFLNDTSNTHRAGNLFYVYFKSFINIVLQSGVLVVIYELYTFSDKLSRTWGTCAKGLLAIAAVVLTLTSTPYLTAIALCSLLCIVLMSRYSSTEDKTILAFALACAYLFPFGSDIGIASIFHWTGALLIIPAAASMAMANQKLRQGTVILTSSIVLVMLIHTLGSLYGEAASRIECTQSAQPNKLNAFVSPEKAAQYQHLISSIQEHRSSNHWLVIGNQACELYYATDMLPYLGNTQLTVYMGQLLLQRLSQQHQRYKTLPTIVFLKGQEFMNNDAEDVQSTLTQWMEQLQYTLSYDDASITIYTKE